MSQPEQPPRFFLDRSLDRKAVPEALRADGWDVITLAEHYGMPADEQVADTDWIEEAAKHGWPILMKDKRIRHRSAEITAFMSFVGSPEEAGLTASVRVERLLLFSFVIGLMHSRLTALASIRLGASIPNVLEVIALAQRRDNCQWLIHRQRARRDRPCSSHGAWVWSPKRSREAERRSRLKGDKTADHDLKRETY